MSVKTPTTPNLPSKPKILDMETKSHVEKSI